MGNLERLALVALGGAVGAMLRYWAAVQFGARAWTTFGVNILGSFCIGIIAAISTAADLRLRLLLATGFLGGLTTFSSWQLEALMAARAEDWLAAAAILLGSLAAGLIAVTAGYWLGSLFR